MALTPQVLDSQVDVGSVALGAPDLRASQLDVIALAIYPTQAIQDSQVDVTALTAAATTLRDSQFDVMVVGRGRVQDPVVRAWPFWLDGHWFYVIRLPTSITLVYDLTTQQWMIYGSENTRLWRAYHGTNWLGSGALMGTYGSNVLCGDDGNGALYLLNPLLATDDDAILGPELPRPFTRTMTGQLTTRNRNMVQNYSVDLMGSIGENDFDLTDITLYTSDDSGHTFVNRGTIEMQTLDYAQRINWTSGLGSFAAPGRLFRIVDNGALQRFDWLDATGSPNEDKDG